MQEGLYKIVAMRRSKHGKWVFTARPVDGEIQFECVSDEFEKNLFNHARKTMWLVWSWDETRGCNVLNHFVVAKDIEEKTDDANR